MLKFNVLLKIIFVTNLLSSSSASADIINRCVRLMEKVGIIQPFEEDERVLDGYTRSGPDVFEEGLNLAAKLNDLKIVRIKQIGWDLGEIDQRRDEDFGYDISPDGRVLVIYQKYNIFILDRETRNGFAIRLNDNSFSGGVNYDGGLSTKYTWDAAKNTVVLVSPKSALTLEYGKFLEDSQNEVEMSYYRKSAIESETGSEEDPRVGSEVFEEGLNLAAKLNDLKIVRIKQIGWDLGEIDQRRDEDFGYDISPDGRVLVIYQKYSIFVLDRETRNGFATRLDDNSFLRGDNYDGGLSTKYFWDAAESAVVVVSPKSTVTLKYGNFLKNFKSQVEMSYFRAPF